MFGLIQLLYAAIIVAVSRYFTLFDLNDIVTLVREACNWCKAKIVYRMKKDTNSK